MGKGAGLAAVLMLLLAAAPAVAREVVVSPGHPSGLAISGDGALWSVHAGGGDLELYTAGPGRPLSRVRRVDLPEGFHDVSSVQGDGVFAVRLTRLTSGPCSRCDREVDLSELWVGPPDGVLTLVERCDGWLPDLGVADSGRLLRRSGCGEASAPLVLRDVASGSERAVAAPGGEGLPSQRFQLRGRYLAYGGPSGPAPAPAEIVVRDLETDTEVQRVRAESLPRIWNTALAADGSLGFSYAERPPDHRGFPPIALAWMAPGDSSARLLGVRQTAEDVPSPPIAFADGGILHVRPVSPCSESQGMELAVADLAGGVRLLGPVVPFSTPAVRGSLAAWVQPGPRPAVVIDDVVSGASFPVSGDRTCPPEAASQLLVSRRSRRLRSRTHVPVGLRCRPVPGTRAGSCGVRIRLSTTGRRPRLLARGTLNITAGSACTAGLRLRRGARALLARNRRTRVKVEAAGILPGVEPVRRTFLLVHTRESRRAADPCPG